MLFFNFDSEKRAKGDRVQYGTMQLGAYGNIECANVIVEGKVFRLVSVKSFLDIVGINDSNSTRLIESILTDKKIQTTKSLSVLEKIRNCYVLRAAGREVHYLDNKIITEFCRVILNVRRSHNLPVQYEDYAANCERFMVGLADVGLVALIDEATGYAKTKKEEYQQLFIEFIRKERSDWVKEFPDSFFDGIYKIYNLHKSGKNHPSFFGAFIAKYVYWPLADSRGAILEKLREKNPIIDYKGRKYKLHQFLTEEVGKKALRDHLLILGTLLTMSKSKSEFKRNFTKAFPHAGDQLEFDFGDEV